MPIPYFVMVAAQIGFIIHAARTGRPWYWITIILFIPAFGILAYIVFELLPGVARSPTAYRSANQAKRLIDPQGDYRTLARTLELTPTVQNRRALADECVRLGRYDEAQKLYREALTGLHATDPHIMLGLARAQFLAGDAAGCLETLDQIKATNPEFQDADGHLLYARSLEALSRDEAALAEYETLSGYYGGEEPRVRRALLLRKTGRTEEARKEFAEVKRSVERSPSFYRRNQREWYQVAQQNLRG